MITRYGKESALKRIKLKQIYEIQTYTFKSFSLSEEKF